MALMTWRELNSKGNPVGPTWYLDFEATLLEEFTRSAEVVTFPVESGALFTDHYQPQPRAVTLEVQVSDTPTRPAIKYEGLQNAAQQPVGFERPKHLDLPVNRAPVAGLAGQRLIQGNVSRFPKKRTASVLQFNGEVTRVVDVFQVLDGLMNVAQPVSIILFGNQELQNLMIVNVRAPRVPESGSTLNFSIDLVQISVANTERSEEATDPRDSRNANRQDLGGRSARRVQDGTAEAAQLERIRAGLDPSILPVL